jgi:serine/threonine protein kinase
MLTPDTVLQGRYRIIRQLGQGGMGAVYEAMDERLDAVVALKETLFADERLRKQFEREARLLARMHHPALPRVSDHFSEGDGQFLVMQYIDGDDLAQQMTLKRGHFPVEQVLTWGDQLLDALDYLHTQDPQIIHRDIKPQNLKLTARGQIILLDFGLAKGQSSEVSPAAVTSASIFGYTPNYAPLEQIQGLGTDERSDIYALSATLYHLMTFVKPPGALTRAASLVNGEPDPLQPANEINRSISPAVASVLAHAMNQNRERRFPTAAKMRRALSDALAGISDQTVGDAETMILNTVQPGRGEAATVLFDSAPATRQASAQVSQAAVAETSIGRGQPGEITVQRQPDSSRRRSAAPWAIGAGVLCLIALIAGGLYAYQSRRNSAAAPMTSAEPENTTTPTNETAPAAGSVADETKAETSKPRVQEEVSKKKPANEKVEEKAAQAAPEPPANVGWARPTPRPGRGDAQVTQGTPPVNAPQPPLLGGRRDVPLTGTTRNLPDGSQIVTRPDGTRVLIYPNGTTRVVPPGVRLMPRRRRLP